VFNLLNNVLVVLNAISICVCLNKLVIFRINGLCSVNVTMSGFKVFIHSVWAVNLQMFPQEVLQLQICFIETVIYLQNKLPHLIWFYTSSLFVYLLDCLTRSEVVFCIIMYNFLVLNFNFSSCILFCFFFFFWFVFMCCDSDFVTLHYTVAPAHK
jgi:hypothetical protein